MRYLRAGHYNNKDSAEGTTGLFSSPFVAGVRERARVHVGRRNIYTGWPLHLHTTSGHPAKPMYAFSYLAPNKPFLRVDSRRDGYGLGTLREQTVLYGSFPYSLPFSSPPPLLSSL